MTRRTFRAALLLYLAATPAAAQPNWAPPVVMTDPAPDGERVEQDGLLGNWYPATERRAPAILLLGGSEGALSTGAAQIATALQRQGFAVLHLSYFRGPGQSPSLELVPLELFDRALAWIKKQPGVDPDRIGVVGNSKGAEAALLLASRNPAVKAVVTGVPSHVAWPGVVWDGTWGVMPKASWSVAGQPVPVVPYGAFDPAGGIRSVYDNGLKALDQHADAIIPVERSRAPMLLVCGEQDTLWPSCPMARDIAERMVEAGGFKVEVLDYPEAGHFAFGPPIDPSSPFYPRLGASGGTIEGNAQARADSWPQVVAFLRTAMSSQESRIQR